MVENRELNQGEYEIDLLELWFLFLSKLKFIIIFLVVGALIAAGITHHFIAPTYEATSKVYVVSASNESVVNLSDLQLGSNLTQDYKELILGRPMLESCIQELGLDCDIYGLKKMISIENPSNTRIINIVVTTTDPELSEKIANKMANLSTTWLPEVMEIRHPNVAEEAVVPSRASGPSMKKNCAIGALALAALYFAICVLRHLLDDTIKTGDDFERYFNIIPLAQIPEVNARRKGHNK